MVPLNLSNGRFLCGTMINHGRFLCDLTLFTEIKVESGKSQSKIGSYVDLSNTGYPRTWQVMVKAGADAEIQNLQVPYYL